MIPKWGKIGFELVAFAFVICRVKYGKPEKREAALQKTKKWFYKQPNITLAWSGQGMGWDGVCVSFHRSYFDYADFIRNHGSALSDYIDKNQSLIVDVNLSAVLKPLNFKYFAEEK